MLERQAPNISRCLLLTCRSQSAPILQAAPSLTAWLARKPFSGLRKLLAERRSLLDSSQAIKYAKAIQCSQRLASMSAASRLQRSQRSRQPSDRIVRAFQPACRARRRLVGACRRPQACQARRGVRERWLGSKLANPGSSGGLGKRACSASAIKRPPFLDVPGHKEQVCGGPKFCERFP